MLFAVEMVLYEIVAAHLRVYYNLGSNWISRCHLFVLYHLFLLLFSVAGQ